MPQYPHVGFGVIVAALVDQYSAVMTTDQFVSLTMLRSMNREQEAGQPTGYLLQQVCSHT